MYGDEALELPVLGQFVQERRELKGWTQRQLANAIPTGTGYISKIEQGGREAPSDAVLDKLSEALDLDEHATMHLYALAGRQRPASAAMTDAEIAGLLAAYDPHPAACLLGWRVTQANSAFRRMWPGLAEADNLPTWLFRDARAKLVTPDWEDEARMIVGLMRHCSALPGQRETMAGVVAGLSDVLQFYRLWRAGVVYAWRPTPDRRVWDPVSESETTVRVLAMRLPASPARLVVGIPQPDY